MRSTAELKASALAALAEAERQRGIALEALGNLSTRGAGRVDDRDVSVPVAAWLRCATTMGPGAATRLVRLAERLLEVPAVGTAVLAGELGSAHAEVLASLVDRLSPEVLAAAVITLLPLAANYEPEVLKRALTVWLAEHAPEVVAAEDADAYDRRWLQLDRDTGGTWRLHGRLDAGSAEAVATVLAPLSRRTGTDDPRTARQRRADALVEACGHAAAAGSLPESGGVRPSVLVLTTMEQLRAGTGTPASSPWTGPVGRDRLLELACDATVRRVLLDPAGQVLDLGRSTRVVSAALRTALIARDGGCTARGCDRPPAWCDAHHLRHWADGGRTDLDDLVLLCRRHHTAWHRGHLTLTGLRVPWLSAIPPSGVA